MGAGKSLVRARRPRPLAAKLTRTSGLLALLALLGPVACTGVAHRALPVPAPADANYLLAGHTVALSAGGATAPTGGGSLARYVGEDVVVDLDGDGHLDRVFLLMHEPGGSGTFVYLVAALARAGGAVGSHGVLIGDRIAPQSVEPLEQGRLVVNFADRAPGEPYSTPPTRSRSMVLHFDPANLQFGEVVADMTGEADPARMTLPMKPWGWIAAGTATATLEPHRLAPFTLTFVSDGSFTATTDCNAVRGRVTTSGELLRFHEMAVTRRYCEGSLEPLFLELLEQVKSYRFTPRGELILASSQQARLMTFR